MDFIHRGTNEVGYVAYGGEFTLNRGPVDSVKFCMTGTWHPTMKTAKTWTCSSGIASRAPRRY